MSSILPWPLLALVLTHGAEELFNFVAKCVGLTPDVASDFPNLAASCARFLRRSQRPTHGAYGLLGCLRDGGDADGDVAYATPLFLHCACDRGRHLLHLAHLC